MCYADWYILTEASAEISAFFFTVNDNMYTGVNINISDKLLVSVFFDYPAYENRIFRRNVSTCVLDYVA
jgi:hypothetical protein